MTTTATGVHGRCDTRFEAVRQAFAENLETYGDVGAAFSVIVEGQPVVDLWGGWADKARTRPWAQDTLVTVYSTTKGLTAICAHRLVEQGTLDLEAPVARYWPEFAQKGKGDVPVHMLLSHRVGLPTVDRPLAPRAIYDWDTMVKALEETEPFWEPGTRHGYHPLTYGWLVGEVVRRVSGRTLGAFFRDEIAHPLGLDTRIGIEPQHDHRIAEMLSVDPPPDPAVRRPGLGARLSERLRTAFGNISIEPNAHNSEGWKRSELPAVNAYTDARSLARLYGALSMDGAIDGVRVLRPETIRRGTTEQAAGPDAVLPLHTRFALGFWMSTLEAPMGPNPRSFGHPGAGGSVGFADPDRHLGIGYVMNQMKPGLTVEGTGRRLIDAVYQSI